MHRTTAVFVAAMLLLASCADDAPSEAATSSSTTTTVAVTPSSSSTTAAPQPVAVTLDAARNVTVTIDGTEVQLRDGDAGPDLEVRVTGGAVGDMTGDGVDDVAMVVHHTLPATTGHISSLVVVHDPGAGPVATNAVHISDIARLHDLRVEEGGAHVRWSLAQFSGEQHRGVFAIDDRGALALASSSTDVMIDGTPDGLMLGANNGGQVPYGTSFEQVREALTAVLGEPSAEPATPTCWGLQQNLFWESDHGMISVSTREGEFFQWWASDSRLGDGLVSPGAGRAWLEQVLQTEFTLTYSEIGGDYITELDARVTLDETGTEVATVGDVWASEWGRLHTVILDPFENPDLWCGD